MGETVSEPRRSIAGIATGWFLSVLSAAALLAVSRQVLGWWFLMPVALIPMVVAQYRLLPMRAAPWAVGVAALGFWLGRAAVGAGFVPWFLQFLIAVVLALFVALLARLDRPYAERTGYRWFLVQMPVLWVGLDVAFSVNPVIASESWLAYDLAGQPGLIQPVSLVGTPTLTFVVLVTNYALALVALAVMDQLRAWPGSKPVPTRVLAVSLPIAAVIVGGWVVASSVLLAGVRDAMGPSVTVAAVQPGIDPASKQYAALHGDTELRRRLERGTTQAHRAGAALVVWPELVVRADPFPPSGTWVHRAAREAGAWLVLGTSGNKGEDPPNKAVALRADGSVAGAYGKQHPVLAELEFFLQDVGQQVWRTPFGVLGATICFDNQYVDMPATAAAAGATIIATPVLVWSGMGPRQQDEIVFRAVENRVAYVRSDWGWSSAVTGPDGVVVAAVPWSRAPREATLVASVPVGPGGSPFTRGGWLVPWLFVAGLVIRLVDQWRTSPRRTSRRGAVPAGADGSPVG